MGPCQGCRWDTARAADHHSILFLAPSRCNLFTIQTTQSKAYAGAPALGIGKHSTAKHDSNFAAATATKPNHHGGRFTACSTATLNILGHSGSVDCTLWVTRGPSTAPCSPGPSPPPSA